MNTKRTRKPKVMPSAEVLWAQHNVSIPEAMAMTRYSRPKLDKLCEDGELTWFMEGERRRINVTSITAYWERKTAESMGLAS